MNYRQSGLLLLSKVGGEAVLGGIEASEVLGDLEVFLIAEAAGELEQEGWADGPGVARAEEVGGELLIDAVGTTGLIEQVVLVMIIDVTGAMNEAALTAGPVLVEADLEDPADLP